MTIVHLESPELSCEFFFFSFFQALCFIFHVSWSLSENLFLYANYVNTKYAEVKNYFASRALKFRPDVLENNPSVV